MRTSPALTLFDRPTKGCSLLISQTSIFLQKLMAYVKATSRYCFLCLHITCYFVYQALGKLRRNIYLVVFLFSCNTEQATSFYLKTWWVFLEYCNNWSLPISFFFLLQINDLHSGDIGITTENGGHMMMDTMLCGKRAPFNITIKAREISITYKSMLGRNTFGYNMNFNITDIGKFYVPINSNGM